MDSFQSCSDMSDLTELSLPQQLYLKPEAKVNITVALPAVRLPGKTISNWEVMERLRQAAQPEEFQVIKVSKSTLEFIRFDGEIQNKSQLSAVISRLDGKVIRLSGFPEPLKIRAAEAKPDFPSRHDWDKFFRDAKNMNEVKPGERPDTVHLQGLPSKWFVSKRDRRNGSLLPSEFALQKVFEIFGEVRCVDIPMLDPYRNSMKASISGIRTFSHTTDATFDAFVQYREYISFVRAMDALRGMKLVHREGVKAYSASIKVDFDKTKHLSDMSIHRRQVEREKLMAKEREKEEEKRREEQAVKQAMEEERLKKEEEKRLKGERRKGREEKRKQRILKKLKKKEAEQMNIKIAIEERKLLMAQRKLESIRLLDELFERVKIERQREVTKEKENELVNQLSKVKQKKEAKLRKKEEKEQKKKDKLVAKEKLLRKKLVKKIKMAQEKQMEDRRERLRKTIEGKIKMKSVLKSKDGGEIVANSDELEFSMAHDSYRGYGYRDWVPRGNYRGRFFPRRPYRGFFHQYGHYPDWDPSNNEWPIEATEKKSGDNDPKEISSDEDSTSTSKYSLHGSSSEGGNKEEKEVREKWPGYEALIPPDGVATHPWGGYTDYYNPRSMRRGGRGRFRPPFRGAMRGFGPSLNPNVPTNSFYMKSINEQYYRYFNKLSRGDTDNRSRSHSSQRVVCRKVLSRSRSCSYSTSSRSRSRSRSRSGSRSRTRSRSKSKSRSQSRSKFKSRSKRRSTSNSRSRSRSQRRSNSKQKDVFSSLKENRDDGEKNHISKDDLEKKVLSPENKNKTGQEPKKSQVFHEGGESASPPCKEKKEDRKSSDKTERLTQVSNNKGIIRTPVKAKSREKSESDWSLSLSDSENGSSPERKAKPLGNPDWQPTDNRRYRQANYMYEHRRFRAQYPLPKSEVRSIVSRPLHRRSRSRSSPRHHLRNDQDRNHKHKEKHNSKVDHRRSNKSELDRQQQSSSHKKDKKRKKKHHEIKNNKKSS